MGGIFTLSFTSQRIFLKLKKLKMHETDWKWLIGPILLTILVASCEQAFPHQNSLNNIPDTENFLNPDPLELEESHSHSRKKRFVYINTQSPVDIGYLIVVPYSFALPTFNLQTSRRKKKSISREWAMLANLTSEEILPTDTFDEPAYAIELNKLSTYFSVLGIDEDICQQKIVCLIFSAPEEFKPLSDLFAKKLTVDHGPIAEKYSSRYYRYVRAMQEGVSGGESACLQEYKRCPYSTKDRFNMPALYFWSFLTNVLRMEFKDDWHH